MVVRHYVKTRRNCGHYGWSCASMRCYCCVMSEELSAYSEVYSHWKTHRRSGTKRRGARQFKRDETYECNQLTGNTKLMHHYDESGRRLGSTVDNGIKGHRHEIDGLNDWLRCRPQFV